MFNPSYLQQFFLKLTELYTVVNYKQRKAMVVTCTYWFSELSFDKARGRFAIWLSVCSSCNQNFKPELIYIHVAVEAGVCLTGSEIFKCPFSHALVLLPVD